MEVGDSFKPCLDTDYFTSGDLPCSIGKESFSNLPTTVNILNFMKEGKYWVNPWKKMNTEVGQRYTGMLCQQDFQNQTPCIKTSVYFCHHSGVSFLSAGFLAFTLTEVDLRVDGQGLGEQGTVGWWWHN